MILLPAEADDIPGKRLRIGTENPVFNMNDPCARADMMRVSIDHSLSAPRGDNNARYSPGDIPFSSRKTLLKLEML